MTIIVCEASALAKVLRDVKAVVKPRQTLAILSHVMIDAHGGQVSITATDMDIVITRTFAAEVEEAGAFTVEASRFTDVVGSFGDGPQIRLAAAEGFVKLTCNRSRFSFPTLAATDFPPMPFADPVATFEGSARLLQALAAVRHAVSANEMRYWLCGAFIGNRDGLEIAATDGDQCLAICRPDMHADIADMILGTDAVDVITKRGGDFTVEIVASPDGENSKVRFTWPDTVITAKLIDGQFPAYRNVIPDDATDISVDGDEIAQALARIALLSDDKARSIKLEFADGKLTVTSRTALAEDVLARAGGGGTEEMLCDYSGEPFTVTIKASLLADALKTLDADEVTLGLSQAAIRERGPIKVASQSRPETTLVVMSMLG